MPHKKAKNDVNNDADLENQNLEAPQINPLQNPAYDPTHSSAKIDYSDPSSPPPPLVEEIEEQYANIPKDQPSSQADSPLNSSVNWDDPNPNAGDHHAKGLFIVGMSISIVIIVSLAGFMVFNSFKKTKNVSSGQKSVTTAQTSQKSSPNYSASNTTDTTDSTDNSDSSSSYSSNDGADNTDAATSKNTNDSLDTGETEQGTVGGADEGTSGNDPIDPENTYTPKGNSASHAIFKSTACTSGKPDIEDQCAYKI